MKNQIIELHNNFVEKGMKESVWVSRTCMGVKGYSYGLHENNFGYVFLDIQKWLREKHEIEIFITRHYTGYYIVRVDNWREMITNEMPKHIHVDIDLTNYEESLEKGLQEALKLIQ